MRRTMYAMLGVGASLLAGACGDDGDCEQGAFQCSGDVLQRCADGAWNDYTDCADLGGRCVLVSGESGCLLPIGVFFNATPPTDLSMLGGTDQAGTGSGSGGTDSGDTGADSGGGGDSDSATTDGERDTGAATDLDTGVVDTDTQGPDTETGVDTASDTGVVATDSESGAVDTDTQDPDTATGVDTASDTGSAATDSDSGVVETDTQTDTATGVDTASDTGAPGCGNGVVEGTEACDDGNLVPFDGCAPDCTVTHDCPVGAACAPVCGDGVVSQGEGCDDGNRTAGDGCGPDCTAEPGYACDTESVDTVALPAVFRDFTGDHPDFGVMCDSLRTGAVEPTLNDQHMPVATAVAASNCTTRFDEWYTAPPSKVTDITLYPNAIGGFVNRYGPNGEPWQGQTAQPISDQPCTGDAVGVTCLPCRYVPTQSCGIVPYDGNPLFFPVDDLGTDMSRAKIPEMYGYNGWPWEDEIFPDAPLHNFYFTSEIRFVVTYRSGQGQTIELIGDDDIWVFVAGHLVVDLGGIHVPEQGAVDLDAVQSVLGLEDGAQYEVAIFQAERKKEGSSLYIGLHNFVFARSRCLPVP